MEREDKEHYLRIWSAIFKEFRGWTEQQTLEWALQKGYIGSDWDYWVLHDPAARPVVWELVPLDLVQLVWKVGVKLTLELESDAEAALWPGQYELENRDPIHVDWPSIRRNFEQVVLYYDDMIQSGVIKYKYPSDQVCSGNIVFAEGTNPNTEI